MSFTRSGRCPWGGGESNTADKSRDEDEGDMKGKSKGDGAGADN